MLRTNFTFSGDSGVVFYLESADLIRFIDGRYGRDKLRTMWSHGGLRRLERDWRAAPPWPGWTA